MARFHDVLAVLQNPGEDGAPAGIYDDLTAAYDADVTDAMSGADAKVAELDAALQASAAEISRLKAANYDLLMGAMGDEPDGDEPNNGSDDDSDAGIDSLFGKDE